MKARIVVEFCVLDIEVSKINFIRQTLFIPTHFFRRWLWFVGILFCFQYGVFLTHGQESPLSTDDPRTVLLKKQHTPWGEFLPGSWVGYRTVTQIHQENNTITNATHTKLTLESVEDNRYLLRKEVSAVLGSQNFSLEPQLNFYDFYQQNLTEPVVIQELPQENLVIGRKQVSCQVCSYTQKTDAFVEETKIWYTPHVMPYLLKTESVRRSLTDNAVVNRKTFLVTETSALRPFGRLLATYKAQTISIGSHHKTVTNSCYSRNVPGGLLREVSMEMDANNKIVSQIETKLLNYYMSVRSVLPQ